MMRNVPTRSGIATSALVFLLSLVVVVPALGASDSAQWTNTYGDPGPDSFSSANAVAVADDGSVYMAGPFFGDFGGETAVDGFDVFLTKLDPEGNEAWTIAWDPDSMDGRDWSAEVYAPNPWEHAAGDGAVFVDTAGDVWVAIAGFVAVVNPQGIERFSRDAVVSGQLRDLVPTAAGGAVGLVGEQGEEAIRLAPDLTTEFQISLGSDTFGQERAIVAAEDGGAYVVSTLRGDFAFQPAAQSIVKLDSEGVIEWSTLHRGRCSKYLWEANSYRAPITYLDEGVIYTQSFETTAQYCDNASPDSYEGVAEIAMFDASNGALLGVKPIEPLLDRELSYLHYACTQDISAPITGWTAGDSGECSGTKAQMSRAVPSRGAPGLDAYGLTNGGHDSEEGYVLVHFVEGTDAFQLTEAQILAYRGEDTYALDIAVTDSGEAVVVGRIGNSADLIVGNSVPQAAFGAESTESPRAFVSYAALPPMGQFLDDNGSVFEADIEWLASEGITKGCNPGEGNTEFCPNDPVTRGQMAAFLARALGLTDAGEGDLFEDDDGTIFESSIDKLATAGITKGCNPNDGNTKFCPNDPVTRGQMAAFLVRALGYSDAGVGDLFVDDDGSIFEASIDKLATAGVTRGCNPSEGNTKFCPHDNVTRGQMAAFLKRALG